MKKNGFRRIMVFLILCVMIAAVFVTKPLAAEKYVFDRMWPTLLQPWYLFRPSGLAIDRNGNLYVADFGNHRILKYSSSGELITKLGKQGAGDGEFDLPRNVAADWDGNVYVADSNNKRIQKFNSSGEFVTKWGTPGAGDGEFAFLTDVATDNEGNVYVADGSNDRIQKFTSSGVFITKWGTSGSGNGEFDYVESVAVDRLGNVYVGDRRERIQKFTSSGKFIMEWGNEGSGDGEFDGLSGVALDGVGNVYVVDGDNQRIQKFTDSGVFISKWGGYGQSEGEFDQPQGIAIDEGGNVYVAGGMNDRIQKFTTSGKFLAKWASFGNEGGQFFFPAGVALDGGGNLYAADYGNHRIQKFTSSGRFIAEWGDFGTEQGNFNYPRGIAITAGGDLYVADTSNHRIQKFTSEGQFLKTWGVFGSEQGQFKFPVDIAIDGEGNVYVADSWNDRIQKFDATGHFLSDWGSDGSFDGQFSEPEGIAIDSTNNVYIADYGNHRIQKFTSAGEFITKWGNSGNNDGEFGEIKSISTDENGNVYVTDSSYVIGSSWHHRVQKFSPNGEFIVKFGSIGTNPGMLSYPHALDVGPDGKIYVADSRNNRIQVFKPVTKTSNNKAIILAGGGPYDGNNLWDATQTYANFAYRALTYQGFTKETIYYLTSDTDLDLDDNGEADDVDADATNENLKHAVTNWAADAEGLVLYLIDHGGTGKFRMSGDETLSASELDSWLDSLQTAMPGKVIVVYDACESGSFLPTLAAPPGKSRIVMTSTSSGETAKFVTEGAISFSNYFWTHIFNGMNIMAAFETARAALSTSFDDQHPLIDANGNGVGNEPADYDLIGNLYIGNGTDIHGDAPVIGSVSEPQHIVGINAANLKASQVTDNDGIARVWAVIRPPDYGQGASGKPVMGLPSVDLLPASEGEYEGLYENFDKAGTYQIAVYAKDGIGNTSIPKLTTVTVTTPMSRKAVIVVGCSQSDASWPVVKDGAALAYEALSYQGYGEDDVYFLSPVTFTEGLVRLATRSNLDYAINTWCMENTQDVVLYLVGNGSDMTFQINPSETVTAAELDSWLDALQSAIPGTVSVIYDACVSGSFLEFLTPPAGKQRIIVSSSSASQPAHFLPEGTLSFSSFFWGCVLNGTSIWDSFLYAKKAMAFSSNNQEAQLDDTGNGQGNEKTDGQLARNYTIGTGIMLAGDAPIIGAVSSTQTLNGETTATLWAKDVTSTGTIKKVWAVMTPPGGSGGSYETPVTGLPTMELLPVGNNRFEGIYTGFDESGTYDVAIFAMDGDGAVSLPVPTSVVVMGNNDCLTISGDLSISVPCVDYNGNPYGFTLKFYQNPDDPSGYYWHLDMSTLKSGTGSDCLNIGSDISIVVPCAAYNGTQYGFTLRFLANSYDPSGFYWKLDTSTLVVK